MWRQLGIVSVILAITAVAAQAQPIVESALAPEGEPVLSESPDRAHVLHDLRDQGASFADTISWVNVSESGPGAESVTSAAGSTAGSCTFTCSGSLEGEACGVTTNNGCNLQPFSPTNFRDVSCGETVCGTLWADGGSRDTDFLRLELTSVTTVTLEVTSNIPVLAALILDADANCSTLNIFAVQFNAGNCGVTTITRVLAAGTYYIFLGPDLGSGSGLFVGFPCGSSNDYSVTISCDQPPCELVPQGTIENEPFPGGSNNGCNVTPESFGTIADGETITGSVWAVGGMRDTDWFEFTVTGGPVDVIAEFTSEFPGSLTLVDGCSNPMVSGTVTSAGCSTLASTLTTTLADGTYVLAVAPTDAVLGQIFDGIDPNDPATNYRLSLELLPSTTGCPLACMGDDEPDACGLFGTDDGCLGSVFLPLEVDGNPACGNIAADGGFRDLDWYEFTLPAAAQVTLDLRSQFPSQLILGQCTATPGVVTLFAQTNGSGCDTNPAVIVEDLPSGAYVVIVSSGFGPLNSGDIFNGFPCSGMSTGYRLTLTSDNPIPECMLSCSGTNEAEACGAADNNGCNLDPPAFAPIALGETVCGTAWASGGDRDTDWWELTIDAPTTLSWTIRGQLPLHSFILTDPLDDCTTAVVAGSFTTSDGDCTLTSSASVDLPCGTHYLFVAPGSSTGNAIFNGFPCTSSQNDYELSVSGTSAVTCFDPVVTCQSDCTTGLLTLEIIPAQCSLNVTYEVRDELGVVVDMVAIPGALIACTPVQFTSGPFAQPGVYSVEVSGSCCAGDTFLVSCQGDLAVYNNETDVVWEAIPNGLQLPPGYVGSVSSASVLQAALEDPLNARATLRIADLEAFECRDQFGPGDTLWVLLGTFPENHSLTPEEGQILADLAASGVSIYIEGGEAWGFDAATAFADFDGVLGRSTDASNTFNFDGDDSFTLMTGESHDDLDVSIFTSEVYTQDNVDVSVAGGSDSTDRLNPTTSGFGTDADIPGDNAGTIWRNVDDGLPNPLMAEAAYATGIFYVPDNACFGRVIAQSWEFGGFGGDTVALAQSYLGALKVLIPGTGFLRGNCNNDASVDIADAVLLLSVLFPVGAPPQLDCVDACDTNDDGMLDIADAIQLLTALFGMPPVVLPDPSCVCGPDPTADALDCLAYDVSTCL